MLSPDAESPLLALDPSKIYCIGGIVDRTVKRGITLEFAVSRGSVGHLVISIHVPTLLWDLLHSIHSHPFLLYRNPSVEKVSRPLTPRLSMA